MRISSTGATTSQAIALPAIWYDVEGEDILEAKSSFFHTGAFVSQAKNEAGNTAGDDPAPPGCAILEEITERVADKGHEEGGDGSKQDAEEGAEPISGLEFGFRHPGGNFDIHE